MPMGKRIVAVIDADCSFGCELVHQLLLSGVAVRASICSSDVSCLGSAELWHGMVEGDPRFPIFMSGCCAVFISMDAESDTIKSAESILKECVSKELQCIIFMHRSSHIGLSKSRESKLLQLCEDAGIGAVVLSSDS